MLHTTLSRYRAALIKVQNDILRALDSSWALRPHTLILHIDMTCERIQPSPSAKEYWSFVEGLPIVLGNKGTLAKYQREHEPIFREQGNKTVQIRGRKHFDIRNKVRRLFLRFYLWSFMYHCHWFFLI